MALNKSEYGFINPMTMIIASTLGLVILQLFSLIMETVFQKEAIYMGPFFMALLVAGAVYLALGIIQNLLLGYGFQTPKDRFKYLITVLGAMLIIVAAYVVIPKIVPELFQTAVVEARAALGLI